MKKDVLKNFAKNSQENTCARVSFLSAGVSLQLY